MKLDRAAFMTEIGNTTLLAVAGGGQSCVWSSSAPHVAEVDREGRVTACSDGETVITARSGEVSASCLVTVGYHGQNPILPPSWGLFIADPEPYCFEGRMYLYGSCDRFSGTDGSMSKNWCSSQYHVIYSDDMIHWTDAGVSFDLDWLSEELRDGATHLWAPDCFRDPKTGVYYLVSCMVGREPGCQLISESSSPVGPFGKTRRLTLNGEPIRVIDPSVMADEDGKVYITWPFQVAQLDPEDYSRVLPGTVTDLAHCLPEDNTPVEGPSLRRRNGIYYYLYIQMQGRLGESKTRPTRMAYLTSENPLGPYRYQGLVMQNSDWPSADNIHGSFTEFRGRWYLSYHMHVPGIPFTRSCHMDEIHFQPGGQIDEMVHTSAGPRGAFEINERVPAFAGAAFSGGYQDARLVTQRKARAETGFWPTPYIYFDHAGQSVCYRYLNLSAGNLCLTLCVKTSAAGSCLNICQGQRGERPLARAELPDTDGVWQRVAVPARCDRTEKIELQIQLITPADQGRVELKWFMLEEERVQAR